MAIDPGLKSLSDITEELKLANEMKLEDRRAEVNKQVIEQTLRDKALEMSEEQRDAMIALSASMKGDKLQTLEDKREANEIAKTQLELLGIIAENSERDDRSLEDKTIGIIAGILTTIVAPIALGLGAIVGFTSQVGKMIKLFSPRTGEFFKNLLSSIRGIPSALFDSIKSTRVAKAVTGSFTKVFGNITEAIAKQFSRLKTASLFVAGTVQAMSKAFAAAITGTKISGVNMTKPLRVGVSGILDDLFKSTRTSINSFKGNRLKITKSLIDISQSVGAKLKPVLDVIRTVGKFFALPFVFFGKIIGAEIKAFQAAQSGIARFLRKNFNIGIKNAKTGTGKTIGRFFSVFRQISQTFATFVNGVFKVGKFFGKIIPIVGTLMIAFDTLKGAFTGFRDESGGIVKKIIAGLFGAIKGFGQSFIGFLGDLLKGAISWLAKKIGGEDNVVSRLLDSFSFVDIIGKVVDFVKNAVFAVFDFIGNMFSEEGRAKNIKMLQNVGDVMNNFIKKILRIILPDPDADRAWYDPRGLVSMAIPSSVYRYAGLDPYTGDIVEAIEPTTPNIETTPPMDPNSAIGSAVNNIVNTVKGGNTTQVNNYTNDPTDILGDSLLAPN